MLLELDTSAYDPTSPNTRTLEKPPHAVSAEIIKSRINRRSH